MYSSYVLYNIKINQKNCGILPPNLFKKISARWECGRPRACCLLLEVGEDGGEGAPAVLHRGAHPRELGEGLQQVQVGVRRVRVGKLFLYNE